MNLTDYQKLAEKVVQLRNRVQGQYNINHFGLSTVEILKELDQCLKGTDYEVTDIQRHSR